MKIRNDFVTNSSSASFVIQRSALSERQIYQIMHHGEIAKRLVENNVSCDGGIPDLGYYDWTWHIELTDKTVEGWTSMDNFNMHDFLLYVVGINPDGPDVEWRGDG